jgi:5'-3' exonuclease
LLSIIKKILDKFQIPQFTARNEAEALCSYLCRKGYVYAVYSTDTDNLAHGCPRLITNIENKANNLIFHGVLLNILLEKLEFNYLTFKDFCIMCGCDYNTKIYMHGPSRCYDLLKKKSLDDISLNLDTQCLNIKECRNLFCIKNLDDLIHKEKNDEYYINQFDNLNVDFNMDINRIINEINDEIPVLVTSKENEFTRNYLTSSNTMNYQKNNISIPYKYVTDKQINRKIKVNKTTDKMSYVKEEFLKHEKIWIFDASHMNVSRDDIDKIDIEDLIKFNNNSDLINPPFLFYD